MKSVLFSILLWFVFQSYAYPVLRGNKKSDVEKPSVLLTIAVVTIRADRREEIRNTWLSWGDDRLVLRFFTEAPDESIPEGKYEAIALNKESEKYGDLVVLNIERGMNFAIKLLSAMEYMYDRYNFDFFLRLDDDYFLCLDRLLNELEATKNSLTYSTEMMLYAGHRYCSPGETRIDEAYMLLSGALVNRVLTTENLHCGAHAGTSAGYWFTVGNDANKDDDVIWINDPRLDHKGMVKDIIQDNTLDYSVCKSHMGVHHITPNYMSVLWEASKDEHEFAEFSESETEFTYLTMDTCSHVGQGISDEWFSHDNVQPCETFHVKNTKKHCGFEGC